MKKVIFIIVVFLIIAPTILNGGNIIAMHPFIDKYFWTVGYPIGFIIPISAMLSSKFREHLFSRVNMWSLKLFIVIIMFTLMPAIFPAYVSLATGAIVNIISTEKYESEATVLKFTDYRNKLSSIYARKICEFKVKIRDNNDNEGHLCLGRVMFGFGIGGISLEGKSFFINEGSRMHLIGRKSWLGIVIDDFTIAR